MPESAEEVEADAALKAGGKTDPFKDIMGTDEISEKMDEVNNREDHRVKGGREIKAAA